MAISNQIISRVLAELGERADSLMIFGSAARGDQQPHSDIDILQVSNRKTSSYKVNDLSISVYDKSSLSSLAKQGSLFILHLKSEGLIIRDRQGIVEECLNFYVPPKSYEPYRSNLRVCLSLLDIGEEKYLANWEKFNSVGIFIFRTVLFIASAETGKSTFSAFNLAKERGEPYSEALRLRTAKKPDWPLFASLRSLLETELKGKAFNPTGSIEAFLCNVAASCPLAVSLGIRLLSHSDDVSDYDLFIAGPKEGSTQ